jgi:flavin-dependent dehydrogenase
MPSSKSFDVIIIGGGPAGAAAAINLAGQGISTALIERSDYSIPRVGETLPPTIRAPLTSLGVWRRFLEDCHIESYTIRSVWGDTQIHDNSHIYNPYGSGWHVDRARFDRMLVMAACDAGAMLLTQAITTNVLHSRTLDWHITSRQPNISCNLKTHFLIDATGKTAALPTGIPRSFLVVDHLISIVRFFAQTTAEPYALVEAGASGWWYSAPVPHNRLVVAHMTDADLFAGSRSRLGDYWLNQLRETQFTYARASELTTLAEPKIVTAASLIRTPACGTDWLAAGDACISFDPLSGRGVYNALNGGILAAKAIIARINGNGEALTEYSKWVNSQFANYLQMRNTFYSKEQRWPKSPFWRRRHSLITRS